MGTNKITGNNMKNSKLRLHIETEISALLDSSLLEDETTELESDELSDSDDEEVSCLFFLCFFLLSFFLCFNSFSTSIFTLLSLL
jgi:hypothetical protein